MTQSVRPGPPEATCSAESEKGQLRPLGAPTPEAAPPSLPGCSPLRGSQGQGGEWRECSTPPFQRTGYVKLGTKPREPGPLLSARVAAFQAGPSCQRPHAGLCWNPRQWPGQHPRVGVAPSLTRPALPNRTAGSGEASLCSPRRRRERAESGSAGPRERGRRAGPRGRERAPTQGSAGPGRRPEAHLEVAALVEGVGGSEDGHLPVVQVALVHQGHTEALHRLLLQPLELEQQCLL